MTFHPLRQVLSPGTANTKKCAREKRTERNEIAIVKWNDAKLNGKQLN